MDAEVNDILQNIGLLPFELDVLNKWIEHFRPTHLAENNSIEQTLYNVLQVASAFYTGCSQRAKESFAEVNARYVGWHI